MSVDCVSDGAEKLASEPLLMCMSTEEPDLAGETAEVGAVVSRLAVVCATTAEVELEDACSTDEANEPVLDDRTTEVLGGKDDNATLDDCARLEDRCMDEEGADDDSALDADEPTCV